MSFKTTSATAEQRVAMLNAVETCEGMYGLSDIAEDANDAVRQRILKPLCGIAIRYRLGDILIQKDGQPDEIKQAAAAYDVHGKKLGLVVGVMDGGASASLMHGLPPEEGSERWQWLETGRTQVETLLKERPELELLYGLVELVYELRDDKLALASEELVNASYWRKEGERIFLGGFDITDYLARRPPKFILREELTEPRS